MKKALFLLLIISSLFFTGCTSPETIEVRYRIIEVKPLVWNTKNVADLLLYRELSDDEAFKQYINAVEYTLICDDAKVVGSEYKRLFRFGPPVYDQLDFVMATSEAKKTRSGKYKLCPEYADEITVKGLWSNRYGL